jgi:WD40 repeat protein/class 3 adenylate cyclase
MGQGDAVTTLIRGRYEQVEVIGSGGQGRVVKALDHLHDRTVALKMRALRSAAEREALLSEAGTLFRLPASPHLPVVREDFFDGDDYVIVMDWVDGTDLATILRADGRPGLPPTLVVQWLADAAAALTHLHTQDPPVIHGDVKPANLILTRGGRVSLVDFGASSTALAAGRRGGTPGYAAPERASLGESTRASDVYSLAATAFALLTGEPPTGVLPSWDGIDPTLARQLESAIREGLATDPAHRPATAGELVERLRAGWASSLPTGVLTFCFTDIVASTALWEAQPVAMSRALVLHDKAVATAVERRGGRLIDAMGEGDSTVSVFTSAAEAVAAAIDLTRDLAAIAWPEDVAVRVRTAVHTGETDFRDGNYFGVTMNIAARLRGLADGGQIVVSNETASLVRDHLPDGVSLVDLGPTRLRGLGERVHVFAVSAPGVDSPPPATECPYPGLLAFGTDDAERYFGRDAVVEEVLARLRAHPFVAVIGASGSGKSSLLQAGVGARWPGGADIVTPGSAHAIADDGAAPSDRLLIVDQFEELFTQVESAHRRQVFVDSLVGLRRPVAIGLRADFYGSCATHRELAVEMANHQVLLGPMTPDELRAAIEQPARRAGLRLETGLVELLVSEVENEPGALPLLAHALRATWDERDGRTLTVDAYRATGGVNGAIASTADQVMRAFDDTDRAVAKRLLLRLVEPGEGIDDTRRRATLAELRPADDVDGRSDHVIDILVAARLVSIDAGTVQVAHEALIREWPQLRSWLDVERDDLRVQRQVTVAAGAWSSGGREPSELFRGPRLATALDWLDRHSDASALEAEFVRESAAEEARERQRQVRANRRLRSSLVGVGIALVAALIGSVVAVDRGRDAAASRDHADVARLAALSRSLVERQPDTGLLLSVEAYRREDSAETRGALLSALEAHPLLHGLIYGAESGLEAAVFSPDGSTLATPASDGSGAALWDVETRRRIATLRRGDDIVLDAAISPDGRTLAAASVTDGERGPTSHLQVWDLETRTLRQYIESPVGSLTSTAFAADGRTLVTQGGVYPDRPPHLTALVWDTATWQPLGEPWELTDDYPDDQVVVVSGDGRVLAIPDGDGITVFDVDTRATRRHVSIGDGGVTVLALTSDGAALAVGLDTGAVRVLDTSSGAMQFELVTLGDEVPTSMEFSRDDTVLAVANNVGRTQLVETETGALLGPALAASSSTIADVGFSADGRLLATTGRDRTGAIWRLDGNRGFARSSPDHEAVATHVAVTPDGRSVVSAGADGAVVVRDLRTGTRRTVRLEGEVRAFDLDADGDQVVAGTTTGEVRVLARHDLRTVASTTFDGASIETAIFNPRTGIVAIGVNNHPGEEAVTQGDEGFVALWDPRTGHEVASRLVEPGGAPIALTWSRDGRLLAVSADNNVLRVYRSGSTYRQQGDDLVTEDDTTTAVAISPDGETIATGATSGIVRQYDLDTLEPFGPALRGHTFVVGGVAYSPDGSLLASTTVGLGTTRLWDAATGTPVGDELVPGATPYTQRTMPIDHFHPSRPGFTPDGATLFTPVADGSIVAWDLRPASWRRAVCELVGRDLTSAEWRQYLGDEPYRRTCSSS